jgi:hypothetical protein
MNEEISSQGIREADASLFWEGGERQHEGLALALESEQKQRAEWAEQLRGLKLAPAYFKKGGAAIAVEIQAEQIEKIAEAVETSVKSSGEVAK